MEPNLNEPVAPVVSPIRSSAINACPVCHQPVPSQYYFCPNCGAKIIETPLSTTAGTQTWIYFFSIILPMICFIFVTKWPGIKYYKSSDSKAHRIGQIAWALIIISTIATIGLAYVWTEQMIQSSINSINTDF
jgi:RNA polymerase subunit RPABC4/transcription elongation factor Spt4